MTFLQKEKTAYFMASVLYSCFMIYGIHTVVNPFLFGNINTFDPQHIPYTLFGQ